MSERRRILQDEVAAITTEIADLRDAKFETDELRATAEERLNVLDARAVEILPLLERENTLDARLASLRSAVVTDRCDPLSGAHGAAALPEPMCDIRGIFTPAAGMRAGRFIQQVAMRAAVPQSGSNQALEGAELTAIELYTSIINQISWKSVAMQIAQVFTTSMGRLTLPKAGEVEADFVVQGEEVADQILETSGVLVTVENAMASIPISNALLDDSPVGIAQFLANAVSTAFATKFDSTMFGGSSNVGIDGIYAGIPSGNKVTLGVSADATVADLVNTIGKVDGIVDQTAWIVNTAGWGDLMHVAGAQQGTIAVGGGKIVPTVWGVPVFKVRSLPANVRALYGDFSKTTAIAHNGTGFTLTAAKELLIRQAATLFVANQRFGLTNHDTEDLYVSALIKATS